MSTVEPPDRHRDPHPDLDQLADLAFGDGTTDQVGRHVAGCPDCQVAVDRLQQADPVVRQRLTGVPADDIPADIAARLEHVLAGASPPGVTVLPPARQRRRVWSPAWLAGAAAIVAVLALGIAVGVGALGGGSSRPHRTTASGATAQGAVTESNRNYTAASLGRALPALLAGHAGPAAAAATDSVAGPAGLPADRAPTPTSSEQSFSAGVLEPERQLQALAQPDELRRCVANLTATPVATQATPWLAVDLARWNGQPAAIILLPSPGKPTFVDAFVVAPGCPTGTFLYYHHYPRPPG